jgi:hypothetical protein
MSYKYDPLPAGAFIRVLNVDLDPAGGESTCSFSTICLDSENIPEFTAVSYTWDHPAIPVSSIVVSDSPACSLSLSRTLHELFEELRGRNERNSALWIDALCIDQGNPAERAAQVAMMDRVFSSAWRVMVWLGPSTRETIPDGEVGDVRASLEGILSAVLVRPWFRRIWVVQEASLNRNVQVLCGSDSTDVGELHRCILAIWKFVEDWEPYDSEPPGMGLVSDS